MPTIIAGEIPSSYSKEQQKLYAQLESFTRQLDRPKELAEIQKDKPLALPPSQLPMVY